jgi:hypothetical protein
MVNRIVLKTKSSIYVFILGMLNKKDNTADSLQRVKRMSDSIAKENHKKDSIADAKRIMDSIAREDSIRKAKIKIKLNYKPDNGGKKYGVYPTNYKKIN